MSAIRNAVRIGKLPGRVGRIGRHPVTVVRSARWAYATLPSVRRQLATGGTTALISEPPVTRGPAGGVTSVLRACRATCLERSLILQAWYRAQGIDRDVVIGARAADGVKAHAWLDGEQGGPFVELTRVPARS